MTSWILDRIDSEIVPFEYRRSVRKSVKILMLGALFEGVVLRRTAYALGVADLLWWGSGDARFS